LSRALKLPVAVANDVRAATWGEWLHGAGRGCDDLVCLFVGTGIGGGVVSGGHMMAGSSNAAGELGHVTVDLHGPPCHCGNTGCLEALASGWAIARRARQAIAADPSAGASLLDRAGGQPDAVTAKIVAQAAHAGDPLARQLIDEVATALIAGSVSFVNAFNPSRLILGGGVIEGLPELVQRVAQGVRQLALAAASTPLHVLPAQLHGDAGVVGAAALAMYSFVKDKTE
jgi:glucokinase